MKKILFKNPNIKLRKENFGGLVKLNNNLYIIGEKEYNFLKHIKVYADNNSNKINSKIIESFLKTGILLEIGREKAKCIKQKYMI